MHLRDSHLRTRAHFFVFAVLRHLFAVRRIPWMLCLFFVIRGACLAQNPVLNSSDVVQYLGKTIDWYRQGQLLEQIVDEPADLTFVADQARIADQSVSSAFDFARESEPLVKPAPASPQNASSDSQRLAQAAAAAAQQLQQTQTQLQTLQKQRKTAPLKKRKDLDSQIAVLQSQLALLEARQDALHNMIQVVSGSAVAGMGTTDLQSQIEDLARTLPASVTQPASAKGNPPQSAEEAYKPHAVNSQEPSGLWGLAAAWARLSRKQSRIKQQISSTDALLQSAVELRTPLVTDLRQFIQNGRQLTQATPADPAALAAEKQNFDELTAQFKQVSAAFLPLNKQQVLLDLYKRSLQRWRDAAKTESHEVLRGLLLRLAILAVVLGLIFGAGEVWRRTIFRYVQDTRRRYQFLLLRRIVLWIAIALVLVFTFSTEVRSIATFAGLITAGVAVALQNVIVSIVAYFFLIGKYGIRVGDRVHVAGVTGEVVDIGLVRFHLMELETSGAEWFPTGRVVAFSNSIVFQSNAGLFKQIPGTSFIWHEVKLTFAAENDYQEIRKRVTEAVETVLRDRKDSLERQRLQMERSLSAVTAANLTPKVRLHFTAAGIEVIVRYPVVFQEAAETDERLMRELYSAADREPKLKLIGSEVPTVKLAA
jgi:small-conductance mechanosensitive channel